MGRGDGKKRSATGPRSQRVDGKEIVEKYGRLPACVRAAGEGPPAVQGNVRKRPVPDMSETPFAFVFSIR
jgi:hypothetical protein